MVSYRRDPVVWIAKLKQNLPHLLSMRQRAGINIMLPGAELEVVRGDESSSSFHFKATQAAVYRIGPIITTQRDRTTFGKRGELGSAQGAGYGRWVELR